MTVEPWYSASETCKVCGEPSAPEPNAFLCRRCHGVYAQGGPGVRKNEARFRAMRNQWDGEQKAFVCHFTGVPLTHIPGSRTFATWEHLTPGDQWVVVLAADLVNKMKGNMTEPQFEKMVGALADHFRTDEPFDRDAFPVEVSPPEVAYGSEPDAPPAP
jgi:hypothetical protein